jgi:cell division protein WhiA
VITSEDVREELAAIAPQRECDRRAELSALFHAAGSLHLRGAGDWGLHLDLGSGAAARRAFALLRDSGIRSEIRTYRRRSFDTATRYQLHIAGDDEALRVLTASGVVDRRHAPLERPPRRVVARSCCRAAYLRGAFLGAGSISLGHSPHMELRTASEESATLLVRLAHTEGVELATVERSAHSAAYAKSWEQPRPCSRWRSEPSSPRRERRPTASQMPTTRISFARAGPPGASSRPSSGCARTKTSTRFPIV